jgi:hypothetical protein
VQAQSARGKEDAVCVHAHALGFAEGNLSVSDGVVGGDVWAGEEGQRAAVGSLQLFVHRACTIEIGGR